MREKSSETQVGHSKRLEQEAAPSRARSEAVPSFQRGYCALDFGQRLLTLDTAVLVSHSSGPSLDDVRAILAAKVPTYRREGSGELRTGRMEGSGGP